MRRLDRRRAILFIDVSDRASVRPRDRKELLARFHAEEDRCMLSGAAAFAAMWKAIPVLRPLGLAARNPAILAALANVHNDFASERHLVDRPTRRSAQ